MLSKEEFAAFLALLLAFAKANGFSAVMVAKALGVSHQTTARWIAEARRLAAGEEPKITAYTFMVEPVSEKLNRLNELNEASGLYAAITRETPQKKLEILHGALDGRAL